MCVLRSDAALLEIYRRFGGSRCLHTQSEDRKP